MASAPSVQRFADLTLSLLADAAFVFAELSPEPVSVNQSMLVARLSIEHDMRWNLVVCVELDLGMILAANLLGVEPESEEARGSAGDAVGELANILAGSVALEFHGARTVCKIGVPTVGVEPGVLFSKDLSASHCTCHLVTEEGAHLAVALVPGGKA